MFTEMMPMGGGESGGGSDLSTKPRLAYYMWSSATGGKCRYSDGTTQGAEIAIASATTTILDNDYVTVAKVGSGYSVSDYVYFKKSGWVINDYTLGSNVGGNSPIAIDNFTSTYPKHFDAGEYYRDSTGQGVIYNHLVEILFD